VVVDKDGKVLSLPRSLSRYSILLAPLYLGTTVDAAGWRPLGWLLDITSIAIFYLCIFNRATRQSLHDLATDAFVIDAPGNGGVSSPHFWRWHWAILGLVLLLFAAADCWMVRATSNEAMPELIAIQQALIQSGKVQGVPNVTLQENKVPPRIIRTLRATVVPKDPPTDYDRAAADLAGIMIKADPQAIHRDYVVLDFVEGFRFGFATYSIKRFVSHTPEDWLKLTAQSNAK
jgi:hypothetical protein